MNQSRSRPLYNVTNDSARLMIGLKWEPRKAGLTDKGTAGAFSIVNYALTLLLWIPGTIVSLFTRRPVDRPRFVDTDTVYNSLNVNKEADHDTARESGYSQYDLDLYCYAYDEQNQFLFVNGPEDENMISDDGVIYSSGEDFTGRGVYDDESAYIDLKKITNRHANLFIVVVSDSKYDFKSLDNKPRIRIVDSKLEKELVSFDIPTDLDIAANCYAYLYAQLSQKDGTWTLHPIEKFVRHADDVRSVIESHLRT